MLLILPKFFRNNHTFLTIPEYFPILNNIKNKVI